MPGPRDAPARAVLLATLAVCGCLGDDEVGLPGDRVWRSTHFRYAARAADESVCDGIVERLERHFVALHAYLGIEPPPESLIRYFKYLDRQDFKQAALCPEGAGGCTYPDGIVSYQTLHTHELIHAYVNHLGRPPSLFEEGTAEALAPERQSFDAPGMSWRELLRAELVGGIPPPSVYEGGAWFVSYLLRRYGPARFLELYAALDGFTAERDVTQVFERVYEVPLDNAWDAALASTPTAPGVPVWQCAGDPVVPDADMRSVELGSSCSGDGPYKTLALAEGTSLTWSNSVVPGGVWLLACALDRIVPPLEFGLGTTETVGMMLGAGRYYLAPLPYEAGGSIDVRASPGVFARSCDDVVPLALTPRSGAITLVVTNGPEPLFVQPVHPGGATWDLVRQGDDAHGGSEITASLEICAGCAGPCRAFDGFLARATMSPGEILRVTGLSNPDGVTMVRLYYGGP